MVFEPLQPVVSTAISWVESFSLALAQDVRLVLHYGADVELPVQLGGLVEGRRTGVVHREIEIMNDLTSEFQCWWSF